MYFLKRFPVLTLLMVMGILQYGMFNSPGEVSEELP